MHLMPKTSREATFAGCMATMKAKAERQRELMTMPAEKAVCGWVTYKGKEIAPVSMYLRWRAVRVTVANINSEGNEMGRGRMPVILAALEGLGIDVVFENVLNPRLKEYLEARGYSVLMIPGWDLMESGPETLIKSALQENPA